MFEVNTDALDCTAVPSSKGRTAGRKDDSVVAILGVDVCVLDHRFDGSSLVQHDILHPIVSMV